jgi:deoxyribodipyrimidine photo-lyase
VPVFVLDDALLHGRYRSGPRAAFMLGCLRALGDELRARGSGLVVRHGRPEREIGALADELAADAVYWTSDVAPYARARDGRVMEALRAAGIAARPHGGGYCVDVGRPRTKAGAPFRVFSPFARAWAAAPRRDVGRAPRALPALPSRLERGRLPSLGALGLADELADPVCEPGEPAARAALARWLADPVEAYARRNDHPAGGTSVLSPYLRWGCLSARECEERARAHGGRGAQAWVRQLCWRDFYAHLLVHHPDSAVHELQARYRGALEWDDDAGRLAAWQEGRTGFPLVDAGMRQLRAAGWMHNRVRLVVGSFLTKDLHLDWRLGEAWFARLLLDGEPAQNTGNWQWIASVGADPAPAFRRMYNPARHQERFDADGTYVRRWVPELRDVPLARLAEPWTMSDDEQRAAGCVIGRDYPAPIVDHAAERRRALEIYGAVPSAKA